MKARARASEPRGRPTPWFLEPRWLAVAVALLTALPYLNAAPEALVYDDATVIAANPEMGGVSRIPTLFRQTAREGVSGQRRLYRPVAMATLALDHTFYGNDPRGYHVTSIVLHVAATTVLFVAATALGAVPLAAALAAVLFGVHPIHTEAVDVAFNRSEILACLGVVGALAWLWPRVEREHTRAWLGVGVLFLLALLSRESAASLPVIVLLALVLLRPRALRPEGVTRARAWLVPLVALGVPFLVYVGLRQAVIGAGGGGILRSLGPEGIGGAQAPWHRLSLVAATVRDYWRMIVWPWPLRASYEDYALRGVPAALALHLALVATAAASWRRWPALTFGIAFFYVALLPSTRLLADPALLAERFVYLPSAGLAVPLAFGLAALMRRTGPPPVIVATLAVAAVLGALTLDRNRDWHSRQALWEAEIRHGADDWRVLLNLSQVRLGQQRFEEAIALCERGASRAPQPGAFDTNRGLALASLGRYDEAEKALSAAAQRTADVDTQANLARLYVNMRRLPRAEQAYGAAIARESDPASRRALEGERLFYCRGDTAGAWQAFQAALLLRPGLPAAEMGLRAIQAMTTVSR